MGPSKPLMWYAILTLCLLCALASSYLGHCRLYDAGEVEAQAREERILAALQRKAWTQSIEDMTMQDRLDLVRILVTEEVPE